MLPAARCANLISESNNFHTHGFTIKEGNCGSLGQIAGTGTGIKQFTLNALLDHSVGVAEDNQIKIAGMKQAFRHIRIMHYYYFSAAKFESKNRIFEGAEITT
jgi:hypothetical protein